MGLPSLWESSLTSLRNKPTTPEILMPTDQLNQSGERFRKPILQKFEALNSQDRSISGTFFFQHFLFLIKVCTIRTLQDFTGKDNGVGSHFLLLLEHSKSPLVRTQLYNERECDAFQLE